jgi:NAD(P)-dependent dehydrogenase (short-subunit alcohol dehydrogenase family)
MFRLDGKVALVTGAGFGMGAGVARALAAQGARVIVNDLREDRAQAVASEIGQAGGQAMALPFDVTDGQAVAHALESAAQSFGPIDILVNNAGNAGGGAFVQKPFADMAPDEWTPFVAVNLDGVMHCIHAVLPGMQARGWGRIVTISSDAARFGHPPGVSVYGAAKAGAAHLTRYVAVEAGACGVTANVVSLGYMNTIGEPFAGEIVRQIPRGRLGTPEDVAAAVLFLSSEEAGYVTGATLAVNGGFPAI